MKSKQISGIYMITCKPTGKSYVGLAKHIPTRWKQHRNKLNSRSHYNNALQAAWIKHGSKAFTWRIVKRCPVCLLRPCERWYISRDGDYNEQKKAVSFVDAVLANYEIVFCLCVALITLFFLKTAKFPT